MRCRLVLLLVLALPAPALGCTDLLLADALATGFAGHPSPGGPPPIVQAKLAVYFRGAGEYFSPGLDDVADELLADGIIAVVCSPLTRLNADPTAGKPARLVLGGHSLGASTAAAAAADLGAKGYTVDELTLIDPVPWPQVAVPPNVRHVTLIRGWAADVRITGPDTELRILDVGSTVPVFGDLWNWTIGHLRITSDPRVKAAALAAARGPP